MKPERMAADHSSIPYLRIEPSQGWRDLGLNELWEYRGLLYFLMLRDIKVKYKQTVIGLGWAVIQPLFTMIVFTLFFGKLAKIPSDGIPYPIFSFAALVPWGFFANGLTLAASSLVGGGGLIKRIYFPRLIIPIAAVFSGCVDFLLAFVILLGMMAYFGITPSIAVLWVPFLLLLAVVTSLGVGLWLSALNAQFRDVRYAVGFLVQIWLYCTPIAYPSSLLPEKWQVIYGLNPMAGVVEGFRWALLGSGAAPGPMLLVSASVSFALLFSGGYFFRRMEKNFADVI